MSARAVRSAACNTQPRQAVGLPLKLALRLVENIFFLARSQDAILQCALPLIRALSQLVIFLTHTWDKEMGY